ncbi:MAG TPA: glycine zipper domain-containing protein [Micropepsaceae bacterium]|nr:glycine zipper domain-containing protein [Micropepsaceae bacterium]
MWKKKTLALVAAVAMAGSAIQPVMAQNYDRGYDNDRSSGQYDNNQNAQYGNDNDRDRYDRDRDRYDRDRERYEADRQAQVRWDRDAYYRDCERQRSGNTVGGGIVGALAGGLLGNSISRGPQRGAGTAVGAILGGVVGASIGNNLSCEDRSYAVDAQYRGFEAGRPHQRYDWRSPRGDSYGYVQVGDYYQDAGRRCTTYTQEIWVHGRPETARGRACRRPDGTWQMIS